MFGYDDDKTGMFAFVKPTFPTNFNSINDVSVSNEESINVVSRRLFDIVNQRNE
jgi:hypothetical protein